MIETKKRKQRDYLLIGLLILFLGTILVLFQLFGFQEEAAKAHIYYKASSEPIVTVDFVRSRIIINYNQETPSSYGEIFPIIDEEKKTITFLGDFKIDGIRQIVVIKYNFDRRSVQVIEEESPKNICSKKGESTAWPLICLPNRIRIEFEVMDDDFTV